MDNNYKAKITASFGSFEFEGPKDFVEQQISSVMAILKSPPSDNYPRPAFSEHNKEINIQSGNKKSEKMHQVTKQPKFLSSLISDEAKLNNLKNFIENKRPRSHQEIFTVITYWMKENLGLEELSINEMWTVYKILGKRPPISLIQVFRDGKSRKGWFDKGSAQGTYRLTPIGDIYVNHDLPTSK